MLLCEFTPDGGSLYRISNEDAALTYQWYSYIRSFPSLKIESPTVYGGYAKATFSDLELSPELFESLWPPPDATIKIMDTDSTEAAAVTLFEGTAIPYTWNQTSITYQILQPEFDLVISSATYADTLVNVVSGICTSLGLTLDSTYARSTSPAVSYTVSSDVTAIDLLSDMCAFFCHGFRVQDSTLYLYDMLGTYTPIELTEFDTMPCDYQEQDRISLISGGGQSVEGNYPNGSEFSVSTVYHGTAANITAALTDILSILDKKVISIKTKIDSTKPRVFDAFEYTDESLVNTLISTGLTHSTIYDFDTLDLTVEGTGTYSTS